MERAEPIASYRDLLVWQRAIDLAEHCYAITKDFPREEVYGLTSQIRRCAVSVAANIAEGYGRDSAGAYIQLLKTSQGSLKELETHLIIARRTGIARGEVETAALARTDEIGRMLRALIRSVEKSAAH